MGKSIKNKTIIVSIFLILLTLYSYHLRYVEAGDTSIPDIEKLPSRIDGYESIERKLTEEEIDILGADKTLYRIYTREDGNTIRLFIGYFSTQQENSQIHSPKHCYPGAGWNIIDEGEIKATIEGTTRSVKFITISDGNKKRLVLYWFRTINKIVSNEFELKWVQMKNALLRKSQMAIFIRLSTDLKEERSKEDRLTELSSFAGKISLELCKLIDELQSN